MAKTDTDFRQIFSKMAPQAIISRTELASLLNTTEGAISQMAYRRELPPTAFPNKRRSCWFVSDIKAWLDSLATSRHTNAQIEPSTLASKHGRPRLPTNVRL